MSIIQELCLWTKGYISTLELPPYTHIEAEPDFEARGLRIGAYWYVPKSGGPSYGLGVHISREKLADLFREDLGAVADCIKKQVAYLIDTFAGDERLKYEKPELAYIKLQEPV
jgi:hypothetical protein